MKNRNMTYSLYVMLLERHAKGPYSYELPAYSKNSEGVLKLAEDIVKFIEMYCGSLIESKDSEAFEEYDKKIKHLENKLKDCKKLDEARLRDIGILTNRLDGYDELCKHLANAIDRGQILLED